MSIFRIALLALGLVISSGSMAAVPDAAISFGMDAAKLATITNDRNASLSTLYVVIDDHGVLRGVYIRTISRTHEKAEPQGAIYWLDAIEQGNGVVVGQGQGVDAIYLSGNYKPGNQRGSLVIRYLTNGIFWTYDTCQMHLRQTGNAWQLVNSYTGRPIRHIRVDTWALGILVFRSSSQNVLQGAVCRPGDAANEHVGVLASQESPEAIRPHPHQ